MRPNRRITPTIPIISNGHGGMIAGEYQTDGKRSPVWEDGTQLFEGEFNRAVVHRLIEILQFKGIPYYQLVPENKDISRRTRVSRANNFALTTQSPTFLIEVHANAAPDHLVGEAHGAGVHISPDASGQSHNLAGIAEIAFKQHFPDEKWRGIKKKKWDIVHKTKMPAILLECFYMDKERECKKFLLDPKGRDRIALWIVDIILGYMYA